MCTLTCVKFSHIVNHPELIYLNSFRLPALGRAIQLSESKKALKVNVWMVSMKLLLGIIRKIRLILQFYNVISVLIGPLTWTLESLIMYHLGEGTWALRGTDRDGLPNPRATNLVVVICGWSLISYIQRYSFWKNVALSFEASPAHFSSVCWLVSNGSSH